MNRRPVHLNFLAMRFPITAWVSVLHRISGFGTFLLIPFFLWMLQESLASEQQFKTLKMLLNQFWLKGLLYILLVGLLYHTLAGIRHLLMDIHIGESKKQGVVSSWITLGLFGMGAISLGCWLW